jgi:hypothetical protein
MSRQAALDNIWLRPCARWGHTQYSLEYHKELMATRLPMSPTDSDWTRALYDYFQLDFVWAINNGLVDWAKAGRVTDMGHAAYATDGSDQHATAPCPFTTDEEVWAFDAVKEYGLPTMADQVRAYEAIVTKQRSSCPNQVTTGGYYRTLVSGAIDAFGWDMLLAAAAEPEKMEKVFDSFFRRTRFFMEAWAKTSVEVVIQHDDFVWTSGPFMHPDYYRRVFIPRYAELWKPLHAAGKKVLFCSDGNFMEFAEDVVKAGADGLIFEPCNDFTTMAERFGDTTCLVGSAVDCRDLTLGKWDQVQRDLDTTFTALKRCKGAIIAVGNHMPSNIPAAMVDKYFAALWPRLNKG